MNNDLNSNFANQNNINFEDNELIQGLNNNIDMSKTTNIGREEIDIRKTQGLKDNINDSNVNTSNVDFTVLKNNNISDNIVNAKVNNNSIDYRVNSSVNVSDNITSVNVNQTNIDTSNVVSKNYDLDSGTNVADPNEIRINSNVNKNVNLDLNIKKVESLNDISDR